MASRLKKAGALTGAGMLAVALVGGYEGLRLYSYRDVVGVWTACYGETRGIKPGMRFTKNQCDAMLVEGLEDFEAGMRRCLTNPDAIPAKPYVAFLSITYNIGTGAWCKSSMARLANAGDLRGACEALMLYTRAGGRTIQGLVNRRKSERDLCLEGLR
jgi:lysozyme